MFIKSVSVCIFLAGYHIAHSNAVCIDGCNRPADCIEGDLAADPDNCKSYYSCFSGSWNLTNCDGATWFDTYGCSCVPEGTQTCLKCPKVDKINLAKKSCINGCDPPSFCSEGDVVAHPSDCINYYFCSFGQWVLISCPPGVLFDSQSCECMHPGDAECLICPTTPPKTTLPSAPCGNIPDPCEDGTRYPDQSDCFAYYPCNNGILGEKTICDMGSEHGICTTSGLPCAFDIYTSECVHPDSSLNCDYRCLSTPVPSTTAENSKCLIGCNKTPFCDLGTYAADPDDCRNYFACLYGEWVKATCPSDFEYDSTSCSCNDPGSSSCLVCPTTPDITTLPSEPCNNIPEPCVDGIRYPDQSDCFAYYPCNNGLLGPKTICELGTQHGSCTIAGIPCAFDMYMAECVNPDGSLVCEDRCILMTTPEMTSLGIPEVTTTVNDDRTTESTPPANTSIPLPHYYIAHNTSFHSDDGGDFNSQCTQAYSQQMNQKAEDVRNHINTMIGNEICSGMGISNEDVRILYGSCTFSTSGNEGVTSPLYIISTHPHMTLSDIHICMEEISSYLALYSAWGDPILDPESGCPEVMFYGSTFTELRNKYYCQDQREYSKEGDVQNRSFEEAFIAYGVSHLGQFHSEDDSTISNDCVIKYTGAFTSRVFDMAARTDNAISNGDLCPGQHVTISNISPLYLTTIGNEGSTNQRYILTSGPDETLNEISLCAIEVSGYLADHTNWEQPILDPIEGCPVLVFNPEIFEEINQEWICEA